MNAIYEEMNTYERMTQEELEKIYAFEGVASYDLAQYIKDIKKRLKNIKDDTEKEELEKKLNMLEVKYNNPANFESEYRTFPSSNAEEKIFKAHLYLVRYYAKKYSKNNSINCTFDDAFQIGSLGLLSACHYYIPGGPAKFTTYASKCIENSIIRSISKRKAKTKRISIEDELERMQYLMQYLKSNIKMEFVGYRRPRVRRMRINNGVIDYNLGLYIKKHNHLMKLIGNNHLIFKRTNRKGATYEEAISFLNKILSESKLKKFFTDDDLKDISAMLNYKNIPYAEKNFFALYEMVSSYIKILKMCKEYIRIYDELKEKNEGVVPNDKEIFKLINRGIRQKKKKRFFHYEPLDNYYNAYIKKFGVEPTSIDKVDNHDEALETVDSTIEYLEEILWRCEQELDGLESCEDESVVVYESLQHFSEIAVESDSPLINKNLEMKDISLHNDDSAVAKELSIAEAIKYYEQYMEDVESLLDFYDQNRTVLIDRALENASNESLREYNKRLDVLNSAVEERNKDIIEINRKTYEVASRLGKVIKSRDFNECTKAISIIYDDELFNEALNKESGKKTKKTLEEEVITNSFMEDYQQALDELDDIQKSVLEYWLDSEGKRSYTAKEIADKLGISDDKRVVRIKTKALKKLSENATLRSYLDN